MGVLLCMRLYTEDVNEEFAACKRQSQPTGANPHSAAEASSVPSKRKEKGTNMFASQGGEADSEYS